MLIAEFVASGQNNESTAQVDETLWLPGGGYVHEGHCSGAVSFGPVPNSEEPDQDRDHRPIVSDDGVEGSPGMRTPALEDNIAGGMGCIPQPCFALQDLAKRFSGTVARAHDRFQKTEGTEKTETPTADEGTVVARGFDNELRDEVIFIQAELDERHRWYLPPAGTPLFSQVLNLALHSRLK